MSASSDVRAVEELGRDLSRLLGGGTLPPEAEEALRSLIALSGRLASDKAGMAATIAAQEARVAELAAQVAALTAQIVQLQRDLYGSRSERRSDGADGSDDNEGADGKDGRRGGRPGRRKERGEAFNDTGLRFNGQAPVIDITVTPPEIEGLSEDDYEVVSERIHCRLAALECRHVVIRYRHVTVKIRETGALAGAPAREGVFKNSCADVSFVAALLIDKFLWHLPLYRQHRMLAAAGITVNRGSLSLWANRATALLKPIHDAQWRSVLQSAVIEMDETPIRAGRHPGKPGSMKKGYFWPVLGDRGEVVFPFAGSRRHRHAAGFLGDYAGTLVSHGYGAYEAYVEARNGAVRHQGCWIHKSIGPAAYDVKQNPVEIESRRRGLTAYLLPYPPLATDVTPSQFQARKACSSGDRADAGPQFPPLLCVQGLGAGRRVADNREAPRSTQVQTTARYAHLARDTMKASAARIGDSIERDLDVSESASPT